MITDIRLNEAIECFSVVILRNPNRPSSCLAMRKAQARSHISTDVLALAAREFRRGLTANAGFRHVDEIPRRHCRTEEIQRPEGLYGELTWRKLPQIRD